MWICVETMNWPSDLEGQTAGNLGSQETRCSQKQLGPGCYKHSSNSHFEPPAFCQALFIPSAIIQDNPFLNHGFCMLLWCARGLCVKEVIQDAQWLESEFLSIKSLPVQILLWNCLDPRSSPGNTHGFWQLAPFLQILLASQDCPCELKVFESSHTVMLLIRMHIPCLSGLNLCPGKMS